MIDYQQMVDRMFLEDPRNEDRSGDMKLHPSAISSCPRQAMYSARGEPVSNPKDVRLRRIMGNGTDYHDRLQKWLASQWSAAQFEVPFEYGPIKGKVDGIVPVALWLDDDGEERWYYDGLNDDAVDAEDFVPVEPVYEVQEYKTISPNGMFSIQGTKPRRLKNGTFKQGRDAAPKPEHVHQARIYHYCLGKLGHNLTNTIRIVYFNRDDWTTVEFVVDPWTDEQGKAQELVWAELEGHLMDGTLPDKMPDDYWLCKLCEFRTTCKGIE